MESAGPGGVAGTELSIPLFLFLSWHVNIAEIGHFCSRRESWAFEA
jgi:hypothetical protein